MKLALLDEAAPVFKESGQVAASRSDPEGFNLAMAAVLALLQSQSPGAAPAGNNSGAVPADSGTAGGDGLESVSLPVIADVCGQEPGQADPGAPAGQVQGPAKMMTAGISKGAEPASEYLSTQPARGPVQPRGAGNGGESGGRAPVFAGTLPPATEYDATALAGPRAYEAVNLVGKSLHPVPAKQNQVPASGPQSGAVVNPGGEAVLGGSVVARRRGDPAVFAAAPAAGASPAFGDDTMAAAPNPVKPGTAAVAQEALLKAVPADNPAATGRGSAALPEGETRAGGGAAGPAGKESLGSGAAGEVEAAKTGDKGAGGSVEKAFATQFDAITAKANSMENLKTVNIPDLKESLIQEIERFYNNRKAEPMTRVDLKLEPEHLGQLTIKLFFSKGELNAHFYTGNGYVKEILEGSMQQLRESLNQQDLKLNQAFVFVGGEGRGEPGQSESNGERAAPFPGIRHSPPYRGATVEQAGAEVSGGSRKLVNYLI